MSRDRDRKEVERRGEDFASRWSRMKRGTRAPLAEPQAVGDPALAREPAGGPHDERSDEEILRELGLPDPETLRPGDDIKGFMASTVPARIRNRVLRRLWTSNPVLANLDGLVDYGGDFTDAAMVPAVLQTAYKVGRGWARDATEDEPEAQTEKGQGPAGSEAEAAAAVGAEADGRPDDGDTGCGLGPAAAGSEEGGAEVDLAMEADADTGPGETAFPLTRRTEATTSRPGPRRMRFRFAEE